MKGGGRDEGVTGEKGAGRNGGKGNWTEEGRIEFMKSFRNREVRERG